MEDTTKPKPKIGRPRKEEDISLETITELMLKFSKKGGFFTSLPAFIHSETGEFVSLSYLDKIKDPEFLRSKSIAFGYCADYWTEQMHQAAIPSAVWIFIKKNVSGWRDNKNVTIDARVDQVNSDKESEEERISRIKNMLTEVL